MVIRTYPQSAPGIDEWVDAGPGPVPDRRLSAVVLAAGEGTRMRSARPKPLHRLCGRPMVLHVLDALAQLPVTRVVVVVGHRAEWVTKTLIEHAPTGMAIEFVEQVEQRGTGDAMAVALTGLPDDDGDDDGDVVVLPGDTPLLRPPTLAALVHRHRASDAAATLLTAVLDDPRRGWATPEEFSAIFGSEDAQEGAVAFLEKRPANWKGRCAEGPGEKV